MPAPRARRRAQSAARRQGRNGSVGTTCGFSPFRLSHAAGPPCQAEGAESSHAAFNWPALSLSCGGAREDEMTAVDNQPGGGASGRDRFIPVRKADILEALIERGRLRDGDAEGFRRLTRLLGAIYHHEYFDRLETLRNDYFYFNPDLPHDMAVDPAALARAHDEMIATLVGVLRKADFVEVAPEDLARSHRERHELKVEIAIPAEDFREVRF